MAMVTLLLMLMCHGYGDYVDTKHGAVQNDDEHDDGGHKRRNDDPTRILQMMSSWMT